jgi:UPF0716 protein FxsA
VLLRRVRTFVAVLALLEVVAFVLVAMWIGVGWTILAMLATSALGGLLLARQGTRALGELRERARERRPAARELGDAGLIAVGGLLMVLPGFIGDLLGLLCLLPGTRGLVRRALTGIVFARLPDGVRGPVRVSSSRTEHVDAPGPGGGYRPVQPLVIEGEVVRDEPPRPG